MPDSRMSGFQRRPRPNAFRSTLLAVPAALCSLLAAATVFVGLPAAKQRSVSDSGDSLVARHAFQTLEKTRQSSEWRLGVGHAIDVIRTDIEHFTQGDHTPDFSIFDEEIVVADARLPSFRLHGLASYQRVVSTLKWSITTACEQSRMEITAMRPPVNSELTVRWRLHLWPRDMLAGAKNFFAPAFGGASRSLLASYGGEPLIVEGYSRYEFHPWTAKIVRHTIDITNPPMLLIDLLRKPAPGAFVWAPVTSPAGMPNMMMEDATKPSSARDFGPKLWSPSLPQSCEDDYECNDGTANFPLQCCELPILGKFCCEPEDMDARTKPEPAYVPLPVPVDDVPYSKKDV